jgi:hypothetical protein
MTTFDKVVKGQEKIERDLTKERDERCMPIAAQVLKMIGDFEATMDSTDRVAYVRAHDPLIASIVDLLQEKDIPVAEWAFVMKLAQIRFDHAKNWVGETIIKNMDQVLEDFWGKEGEEVTFSDIALKKKGMIQSN